MSPRRTLHVAVTTIILLNLASLWPVLDSPYLGDDSWRESAIRGIALLADKSLLEICWGTVKDYAASGRWYPLIIYYCPVFFYLDQTTYKTVTLFFTVFNVIGFGYLVKVLTSSRLAGLVAMMLPPLFFQLRFYHDPILSYYFLMQLEFSLITATLVFFVLHLKACRPIYMPLSVLAFTVCLMIYESAVAFSILPVFTAYYVGKHSVRNSLNKAWPFLIVTLINVGIILFVRIKFGVHYEGVRLSLDPLQWLVAFGKQLFAGLPMSFFASGGLPGTASIESLKHSFLLSLAVGCLWAAAWFMVSYFSMHDRPMIDKRKLGLPVALGCALWVLPSALVAFSEKYQTELKWGIGYLPVYWSYFGVMLIASSGILLCARWLEGTQWAKKWTIVGSVALLGGIVSGTNYQNNITVVERYNAAEHYPRKTIERALRCGLFRPVPESSYLLCGQPNHSWDTPPFFRLHSGLTVGIVGPESFSLAKELGVRTVQEALGNFRIPASRDIYRCNITCVRETVFSGYEMVFRGRGWPVLRPVKEKKTVGQKTRVYYLKYDATGKEAGYAILAEIASFRWSRDGVSAVSSDNLYVYVDTPVENANQSFLLRCSRIDESLKRNGTVSFQDAQLELVYTGMHGRIYHVPKKMLDHSIDPSSSFVVMRWR